LYIARTKNNIGNIFFQRRDLAKALQYYSEALTEERTLNDSLGMPMALINVANVYNQLGNADSGLVAMNEAIAIYNIQGNKSGEALALSNLSIIHRDRGELEKALAAANRSLTLNTAVGSGYQKSHSLFSIAKIYAQMKEYDQAIAMYHQGLLITDQLSLKSIAADIHQGLSTAHKAKANYEEALRHAEVARTINDSLFHDSKNKLVAEYEARY